MNIQIDWFCKFIRVIGVNFPVSSSLVQIQAEIDSKLIEQRLAALEDPISVLHADIHIFSKALFDVVVVQNSVVLEFTDEFYKKYSRVIAVLEREGLIQTDRAAGNSFPLSIILSNPLFIMYIFALYEDPSKMEVLFDLVDNCTVGIWLDGETIDCDVSIVAISAMFCMFSEKGYGLLSNEIGVCRYLASA